MTEDSTMSRIQTECTLHISITSVLTMRELKDSVQLNGTASSGMSRARRRLPARIWYLVLCLD